MGGRPKLRDLGRRLEETRAVREIENSGDSCARRRTILTFFEGESHVTKNRKGNSISPKMDGGLHVTKTAFGLRTRTKRGEKSHARRGTEGDIKIGTDTGDLGDTFTLEL